MDCTILHDYFLFFGSHGIVELRLCCFVGRLVGVEEEIDWMIR